MPPCSIVLRNLAALSMVVLGVGGTGFRLAFLGVKLNSVRLSRIVFRLLVTVRRNPKTSVVWLLGKFLSRATPYSGWLWLKLATSRWCVLLSILV